ncbi:hypothetical protein H0H92_012799 [Tricholoma furcatifolium]|nr:hypothetical protein H0H92_012799 [Tricholoma furcatifolium]
MSSPSVQNALFLESKQGAFVLRQTSIPKPSEGQLLVRNEAVGLNPLDWKIQKFGRFIETFPAIIGLDAAGVVEEVGGGVEGFEKGDRANFIANDQGAYQQYIISTPLNTAKIPSSISFDQAASVPETAATAAIGLYVPKPHGAGLVPPFEASTQGKDSGRPIFIVGGTTSVGQYAIQFARLSGFSPIFTTASPKHEAYLKSLGATHVFDRNLTSTPSAIVSEIRKVTSVPVEVAFDAVSLRDTQTLAYSVLERGASLILVLPAAFDVVEGKEVEVHQVFGMFTPPHSRELGKLFYGKITALLEKGDIKPNRVGVVPGGLSAVVGALKRLESGEVSGVKLVVHPQETS